jgi:hypothetical protein
MCLPRHTALNETLCCHAAAEHFSTLALLAGRCALACFPRSLAHNSDDCQPCHQQGLASLLLNSLVTHSHDGAVVAPLLEAVVGLSRSARGAAALMDGGGGGGGASALVQLSKELLVNHMVSWAGGVGWAL